MVWAMSAQAVRGTAARAHIPRLCAVSGATRGYASDCVSAICKPVHTGCHVRFNSRAVPDSWTGPTSRLAQVQHPRASVQRTYRWGLWASTAMVAKLMVQAAYGAPACSAAPGRDPEAFGRHGRPLRALVGRFQGRGRRRRGVVINCVTASKKKDDSNEEPPLKEPCPGSSRLCHWRPAARSRPWRHVTPQTAFNPWVHAHHLPALPHVATACLLYTSRRARKSST